MTDSGFRPLVGERVIVRRFRDEDAATLAEYRSDPDVARYQSWTPPYPEADAAAFIRLLRGDVPGTPGEWFQYAVEERATGKHVGDVASHTHDEPEGQATIGVTFAAAAQGRGLAIEALTLLIDHLIEQTGARRVVADCDPRNDRVVALLERLGMRREAHHLASYPMPDGSWSDEYVYATLVDEWRARRSP